MSVVVAVALVSIAAAVGGLARSGLAGRFNHDFPVGTLLANVLASVWLGFLVGWGDVSELVIGVGFAGSLSTWSTLANETVTLFSAGRARLACLYLSFTLVAGVGAGLAGLTLGSLI